MGVGIKLVEKSEEHCTFAQSEGDDEGWCQDDACPFHGSRFHDKERQKFSDDSQFFMDNAKHGFRAVWDLKLNCGNWGNEMVDMKQVEKAIEEIRPHVASVLSRRAKKKEKDLLEEIKKLKENFREFDLKITFQPVATNKAKDGEEFASNVWSLLEFYDFLVEAKKLNLCFVVCR